MTVRKLPADDIARCTIELQKLEQEHYEVTRDLAKNYVNNSSFRPDMANEILKKNAWYKKEINKLKKEIKHHEWRLKHETEGVSFA